MYLERRGERKDHLRVRRAVDPLAVLAPQLVDRESPPALAGGDKLDRVADVMLKNPGSTAVVEGHADRRDTSKRNYNIRLSEKRAKAVARYFEGKGISADRLKAVGYGFDHPKAANDPKNGNLANRRVEVYIDGARPGKVNYVNPAE